jgi:GxxExxY protein
MSTSEEYRKAGAKLRDSNPVIASAITANRHLARGFFASLYQQPIAVEFALRGLGFIRQARIPLFYRDHRIGEHTRVRRGRDLIRSMRVDEEFLLSCFP